MEINFNFPSFCLTVFLAGITTLGFTNTTYAGQWILDETNEWYYVKNNGQYASSETLLDDKGNIYTFASDGKMYHSTTVDGLEWDESGAWINKMAPNDEFYESKLNEYRTNGKVTFKDKVEYLNFLNYVTTTYFMDEFGVIHYLSPDGEIVFTKEINTEFDSVLNLYNQNKDYLNNIVVQNKGATDAETVRKLTEYVVNNTTYNVNCPFVSDIIATGKGRCSSYTRLLKMLCNLSGIKCEEVYCDSKVNGEYHSVNRVWYDGAWHYIDLTFLDSSKNYDKYYDISYDRVLSLFKLRNNGTWII